MDIQLADARAAVSEACYEVLQDMEASLSELNITALLTFGFKLVMEQEISYSIDLNALMMEGKKESGSKIEDNQENMDIEKYAILLGFKKKAKKLFEDFKGLFEEIMKSFKEFTWKSGFESGIAFSITLTIGK